MTHKHSIERRGSAHVFPKTAVPIVRGVFGSFRGGSGSLRESGARGPHVTDVDREAE